jgi:ABC-type phosphate transport system auxiliary subunit
MTTGWVHTGLIMTLFLLLLMAGAGMGACWWKCTSIKHTLLESH